MEDLITPQELAEHLKVKEQTLRMWASKGRGPAYVMIEGQRRYKVSDVQDYINSRTVQHG